MTLALFRMVWGWWEAVPPKVKLAIVAVLAIVGLWLYHVSAVKLADHRGYARAATECKTREDAAREAYERELAAAKQRNQNIEATHQAEMAIIGADYEKVVQDGKDQRDRDVAAARAGAIRLRVAGACPAGRGPAPEAAAPAQGRDGAGDAELPGPVAADLLGLADDADATARRLGACQAVIRSYLATQETP